jgi:hypothetical protein
MKVVMHDGQLLMMHITGFPKVQEREWERIA